MINMGIVKGVESMLEKEKVDFIKIEGKVSSEARKSLVDRFQQTCNPLNTFMHLQTHLQMYINRPKSLSNYRFQTVDSVKVALLSITV